jgi:malonyl-CoA O-methyltransferase
MKWFPFRRRIPTLPPLDGYNRWASSYAAVSNPIKDLSDKLVEKWLPDLADKTFLDAGCGPGKFCALAAERGASGIVGVDLSPVMIEQAVQHCPSGSFICDSIVHAPLPSGHIDVALTALMLGHVEDLNAALEKITAALAPGGLLIVTDFHPFATLQNASRTFRDTSGKQYAVQHHLHLFEDYFRIIQSLPLIATDFEEPRYNGNPVVFGLRMQKIP